MDFKEGCADLPIAPEGGGGFVPVFLKKSTATSDFGGGSGLMTPTWVCPTPSSYTRLFL